MVSLTRRQLIGTVIAGTVLAAGAGVGIPTFISATSSRDPWRHLREGLRGRLFTPDDARYWPLTSSSNGRYLPVRPQAVAAVADAEDAAACIRWCRENNVPFAVRGGGHSFAGFSTSTGLVISTANLTTQSLDARSGRLIAGAGLTNADLAKLQSAGGAGKWLLPGGSCLSVGIGGLVLGGGVGPNSSWAGLTADRLRETTVVTAAGDIVTASATENSDLFWAARGAGGGNFGLHADFTFDPVPAPASAVTSGVFSVVGRQNAVSAAMAWQDLVTQHPDLVSGSYRIEATEGNTVAGSARLQVLLGESDARALLAPVFEFASVVDVAERRWWDAYNWYNYASPPRASNWYRSHYVYDRLTEDALDQQADYLERFDIQGGERSAHLALQGYVGGEVNAVGRTATAYVHRGARMIVRQLVSWPSAAAWLSEAPPIPRDLEAWGTESWSALSQHTSDESYQNFPDPAQRDWPSAYYAENLPRLSAIKRSYDPDNVFSFAQAVPLSV